MVPAKGSRAAVSGAAAGTFPSSAASSARRCTEATPLKSSTRSAAAGASSVEHGEAPLGAADGRLQMREVDRRAREGQPWQHGVAVEDAAELVDAPPHPRRLRGLERRDLPGLGQLRGAAQRRALLGQGVRPVRRPVHERERELARPRAIGPVRAPNSLRDAHQPVQRHLGARPVPGLQEADEAARVAAQRELVVVWRGADGEDLDGSVQALVAVARRPAGA